VIAHLATNDERMTGHRLAGVVIGLIGVAVMVGPDALAGLGSTFVAQLAVLGAALSYACASIFGRRFRRMAIAPLTVATGQVSASTLLILPIALLVDAPWILPVPGPAVWGAVLGTALLSTALAYIVFFQILATAGATNISLVTFLIPVSAILLGALVLGERLDPRHVIGMALIAGGLAAIDGRVLRSRSRRGAQIDQGRAAAPE
jgi:drug/metabolite transporter (DMT)-like permease